MRNGRLKQFFYDLINTDNDKSSKRFIILVAMLHFIIGSFLILGLFTFVAIRPTKGDLEFLKIMNEVLKAILEYDFFIIIGGLGFVTVENLGKILVRKFTKWADSWGGNGYDFDRDENNYGGIHQTIIGGNIKPDTPENP